MDVGYGDGRSTGRYSTPDNDKPYWRRRQDFDSDDSDVVDITRAQKKRTYKQTHTEEVGEAMRDVAEWVTDLPDEHRERAGEHRGRTVWSVKSGIWAAASDDFDWDDIVEDIVRDQHEELAEVWGMENEFGSSIVSQQP